ncbi:hypothetical protein [Endozoicomonas sp. 4G]|uniref:hypothetical protein n=1 Tax=Endozoicomonas sp. 4G TaxID=2872754 RepID=UPI002078E355|nr:hypothetical protein [Endozoicomonas sp. 4G]
MIGLQCFIQVVRVRLSAVLAGGSIMPGFLLLASFVVYPSTSSIHLQELSVSESLFKQLKDIGIDEELAAKVSASLDPDHNATKKDLLNMQEAILQHQTLFNQKMADMNAKFDAEFKAMNAKSDAEFKAMKAESDARYFELKMESNKIDAELKVKLANAYAELKTEIHTVINRQYLVTFGSALMTIASVLAVNWYFNV